MSNPQNLVRPPVLNAPPPTLAAPANTNNPLTMDQLTEVISGIVTNMFQQQGRNMVQAALNPNASFSDVRDITIDTASPNISELDKIPDVVRCLREFSGAPGEFNSWKKSVDRILQIYEPQRGSPKYYGILNVIRNKIVGNADIALESYNTPLDWKAISRCLTLHYADKRDLGTLEYQMTSLVQGNLTIQEFYQRVYSHMSLILNKLGCMDVGTEAMHLLTRTYRDKALDTFIRGLKGDLPRLLGMREPVDLPQALHLCLKLENQNFRSHYALVNNGQPRRTLDIRPPLPPKGINNEFYPELAFMPQPRLNTTPPYRPPQPNYQYQSPQTNYQFQHPQPTYQYQHPYQQNQYIPRPNNPPPRPAQKPQPRPEPMDIDPSLRTRNLNYMNKPRPNDPTNKRPPNTNPPAPPNKIQRNYHIEQTTEQDQYNLDDYNPTNQEYETNTNDTYTNDTYNNDNTYNHNNSELTDEFIDTTDLHFLE